MSECKRVNYLGRFIIFLYIFIAASVFKYRHEGETDMDMIMNFDSVIFFQKVYIDKESK
jgi:hypothetical protein